MFRICDRFGNPLPTVTTTDDTPVILDSLTLEDNTCCYVNVIVVATESGGGNVAATEQKVLVRRNGGGLTIEGSAVIAFEEFSNGSWTFDLVPSGNDIEAIGTGVAATDITWEIAMQSMGQ